MKLKKRWAAALLLVLVALHAAALAAGARVYDMADLFSAQEEKELEEAIARFQEETGMDFVIVTSDEPVEDGEQHRAADEFYIRGDFGLDAEGSGVHSSSGGGHHGGGGGHF